MPLVDIDKRSFDIVIWPAVGRSRADSARELSVLGSLTTKLLSLAAEDTRDSRTVRMREETAQLDLTDAEAELLYERSIDGVRGSIAFDTRTVALGGLETSVQAFRQAVSGAVLNDEINRLITLRDQLQSEVDALRAERDRINGTTRT